MLIMQAAAIPADYKILYKEATVKYDALHLRYTALEHEVAQLKKMIFGSRQERFIAAENNAAQLTLDIQSEQTAQCNIADAKKISYTRLNTQLTENKKEHPGRTKLPEHLERREHIIEPAEDITHCKKIGEEITEELEYEPGRLYVTLNMSSLFIYVLSTCAAMKLPLRRTLVRFILCAASAAGIS